VCVRVCVCEWFYQD
jgi:hypothetical protein